MTAQKIIRIGSRESKLAVAQTRLVMDEIQLRHPELLLELVTMKTTGDKILDRSLDQIGGKGLFVKELDRALLDGKIDLSIHSLKDMPMETPEELPILAFSKRGDPRDCLIFPQGEENWDYKDCTLPAGCSGNRRKVQIRRLFEGVLVKGIRGNILTRIEKLDAGEYGALILACAGLDRLNLQGRMSRIFSTEEMIPSAGQGVLAVQGRQGEDYSWLEGVDDPLSRVAATAERQFVRVLDGGCSSPIAAYAQIFGSELKLTGLYFSEAEGDYRTGNISGEPCQALALGEALALRLKMAD